MSIRDVLRRLFRKSVQAEYGDGSARPVDNVDAKAVRTGIGRSTYPPTYVKDDDEERPGH